MAPRLGGLLLLAAVAAADVPGPRRLHDSTARLASAHLGFTLPDGVGDPVASWYNAITPMSAAQDTYFVALAHDVGHMGLKMVDDRLRPERVALFTVWDAGCAGADAATGACPPESRVEVVECGRRAVCSGGDGLGGEAELHLGEWELDHSYGFVVMAFQEGTDAVRYEGYFHAPEFDSWQLLAKLKVSQGSRASWGIQNVQSFVEHFTDRSPQDVRWASIGPSFFEHFEAPDNWTQIVEARFSHSSDGSEVRTALATSDGSEDATHVHANVTTDGDKWGLGIGGDLVQGVVVGASLAVQGDVEQPEDMVAFLLLRADGELPTGCAGGTCWDTAVQDWIADRFNKDNILVTVIVLVLAVCACCALSCCFVHCCPCCRRCRCCCRRRRQVGGPAVGKSFWTNYTEGEPVLVWVKSKGAWLEGTILEIAREEVEIEHGRRMLPGSQFVETSAGQEWIGREYVMRFLRKLPIKGITCGEGHKVYMAPSADVKPCDGCGQALGGDDAFWSCGSCPWRFCPSCAECGADLTCPKGSHRLMKMRLLNGPGKCSKCRKKIPKLNNTVLCKACRWYLCGDCFKEEMDDVQGWEVNDLSSGWVPVQGEDRRALESAYNESGSAEVHLSMGRYRIDGLSGQNLDTGRMDLRRIPRNAADINDMPAPGVWEYCDNNNKWHKLSQSDMEALEIAAAGDPTGVHEVRLGFHGQLHTVNLSTMERTNKSTGLTFFIRRTPPLGGSV